MEVELFDVEEEKVEQICSLFYVSLLDMVYFESYVAEVFSVFDLFGGEAGIDFLFFQEFFDLSSSSFVIEKAMFGIYENLYFPASRYFFQGFEYFIEAVRFGKEEFHEHSHRILVKSFFVSSVCYENQKYHSEYREVLFDI